MADAEAETPWWQLPFKAIRDLVPERYPLLRLAIPTQVFTLSVAYLLVRYLDVKPNPIRCTVGLWAAVKLIVMFEVAVLGTIAAGKLLTKEIEIPEYLLKLLEVLKKTSPLEILVTCISVGFVEEVAFRGVLLPLAGATLTTVIFAVAHRPKMWLHWLSLLLTATVFTLELRWTGGLLVPIVHHALRDGWLMTAIYAGHRLEREP